MTKRKSENRFEQLRWMQNELFPTLPKGRNGSKSSMVAVLYSCWTQAWGTDFKFNATNQQIAEYAGLKERTTIKIMQDLERAGVVLTLRRGVGHSGSVRKLTFEKYQKRGAPDDTPGVHPTTKRGAPDN